MSEKVKTIDEYHDEFRKLDSMVLTAIITCIKHILYAREDAAARES